MQYHHSTNESFDIIVIGGGHAGCEAAITTAKLGFSTALFTINLDRIAWQPCNPAVGGPAYRLPPVVDPEFPMKAALMLRTHVDN